MALVSLVRALGFALPLLSQFSLATAQVSQAGEARHAFQNGVAAYRDRDLTKALVEFERAASVWPTQWRYAETAAQVAHEAGDTSTAHRWLRHLASLGVASPRIIQRFWSDSGSPYPAELRGRFEASLVPIPGSRVLLALSDTTFFPEGIGFDPRTETWYLGSIRHGGIIAVRQTPDGAQERVLASDPILQAVSGIQVDTARGLLWVTSIAVPEFQGYRSGSERTGVVAVDLETGVVRQAWWLEGPDHHLGDLTLGLDGSLYLTDSKAPTIFLLRPGEAAIEPLVSSPAFRSLQGIALHPEGRVAYVTDWSHGIFRIDLQGREVTLLEGPERQTLLGIDGLYWTPSGLIGIQNGVVPPRIVRLTLNSEGTKVTRLEVLDRHLPVADEPTLGVLTPHGFGYVANSHWEKYAGGKPRPDASLAPPRVLLLPLP